jgi:hypothetical protein
MMIALWIAAAFGGLYILHRVARWAEDRGFIYYRRRSGSSGSLGSGFLEVQAIFEPSKRYVIEEHARDEAESDDEGGPADPARRRGQARVGRQEELTPKRQ